MGHRNDGAVECIESDLQRLGAREIEVVSWLVQEQQGRTGKFEQENLKPCLLTAGKGVVDLL